MKCPLTKNDCLKEENVCPWWIKLIMDKQEKGRCSIAWIPILLIELRQSVDKKKKEEKDDAE